MGVANFFSWLLSKCPTLVTHLKHDIHVDCLYLDMNGILHTFKSSSQDQMMINIFLYIEELVNLVRPRRYLFLALDGVAPMTKIMQQRQRRYSTSTNSQEEEHKSITPGTEFMKKIVQHMQYFIRRKMQDDKKWRDCKVIFSGGDVAGEGEHKIMDFIRKLQREEKDKEMVHCMYGMDSDLIMLALATHEPNFILLREFVDLSPKKKFGKKKKNKHDQFQIFHISVLRELIDNEFKNIKLESFKYDLDRIIDDFILMLFLCGNDFLPQNPTLDIGEGALNYFFGLYRDILPKMGGYITCSKDATICWERLEMFIKTLADLEVEVLNKRAKKLKIKKETKDKIEQQPEEEEDKVHEQEDDSLLQFINVDAVECLNCTASNDKIKQFLVGSGIALESESDEQLMIKIPFIVPVKLKSVTIEAKSKKTAPKDIEFYVNQPEMGFDDVSQKKCSQKSTLTDSVVELKATKFQNVSHLTIFIENNHGDEEVTTISSLKLYGEPKQAVIGELKKQRQKFPRTNRKFKRPTNPPKQLDESLHVLPKCLKPDSKQVDLQAWKQKYYEIKMNIKTQKEIDTLIRYYLEGLAWNFKYYFQGNVSWEWFYPYHYAPCASDLTDLEKRASGIQFQLGAPLKPFEQLLCVLPPKSKHLLPQVYQSLMTSESSPLIHMFPTTVQIDTEKPFRGKKILPFVDVKKLKEAVAAIDTSTLKKEEIQRNLNGVVYQYTWNSEIKYLFKSSVPDVLPDVEDCSCEMTVLQM